MREGRRGRGKERERRGREGGEREGGKGERRRRCTKRERETIEMR